MQTGKWDTTKIDIVSDISSIPVNDRSFEYVLCTEVLEHVPDPIIALQEMVRILEPKGKIIITVPFCSLTHFAPYHYSTGLSLFWFKKHLPDLGCIILEAIPNGSWFDYIAQEIWRLPYIGSNYSKKILGFIALLFSLPLLVLLRIMKVYDKGSSELLTFGWHIVAQKDSIIIDHNL